MNPLLTRPGEPAGRLACALLAGDRRALVDALALVDDRRPASRTLAAALLDVLPRTETLTTRRLVGITGSPGAGKSTLVATLARAWRERGHQVGVLAVDPSSVRHGGALLGDRVRMQLATTDESVFVRSLADRGLTGGLSREVLPMVTVMLAVFDRVIVETVGVGQRETDVAQLADTTCLVLQPGAGDRIQMLKAGIMEVPDRLVINKADLGALATQTHADLESLPGRPPVNLVSATEGTGIAELIDGLEHHHHDLRASSSLVARRRRAVSHWLIARLAEEFGTHGIDCLGGHQSIEARLSQYGCACLTALDAERQRIATALDATPSMPVPLPVFTAHRKHTS